MECLIDRAPDEPLDVICSCFNTFCFNCKEEAHRPVSKEDAHRLVSTCMRLCL